MQGLIQSARIFLEKENRWQTTTCSAWLKFSLVAASVNLGQSGTAANLITVTDLGRLGAIYGRPTRPGTGPDHIRAEWGAQATRQPMVVAKVQELIPCARLVLLLPDLVRAHERGEATGYWPILPGMRCTLLTT